MRYKDDSTDDELFTIKDEKNSLENSKYNNQVIQKGGGFNILPKTGYRLSFSIADAYFSGNYLCEGTFIPLYG
jgi:hypothetical protein